MNFQHHELRIVIDVTPGLMDLLLKFCPPSHTGHWLKIVQDLRNQLKEKFTMNEIDNLKAAVADDATAQTEGAALLDSALAELASDITKLPGTADIQAATDSLVANVAVLRDANAKFAQTIRDAIPTEQTPPA